MVHLFNMCNLEFEHRYGIFKENLETARLMQDSERGTAYYGITQFSDLTSKKRQLFIGFRANNNQGVDMYLFL